MIDENVYFREERNISLDIIMSSNYQIRQEVGDD